MLESRHETTRAATGSHSVICSHFAWEAGRILQFGNAFEYLTHRNVLMDTIIVLRTIPAVLFARALTDGKVIKNYR
jgi:hypothetical protein